MNKYTNDDAPVDSMDSSENRTHVPANFADSVEITRAADAEIRTAVSKTGSTWQQYPHHNWHCNTDGTATAKAYAMQGILKYHGLADWHWRTAFMPSISVNNDVAHTITRVDFDGGLTTDILTINGKPRQGRQLERVSRLLDHVRNLAGSTKSARVQSRNVIAAGSTAKGLGTSAAAGAALATAALAAALGPDSVDNLRLVSCTARLLAGSACRSAVGGLALWLSYPGIAHDDCFAVHLDTGKQLAGLRLITVPIESRTGLQTEQAHRAAPASALFRSWVNSRREDVMACLQATSQGDWETLGRFAELDSLRLHGVTMSAGLEDALIAWEPETISLFHMCHRLRENGVPVFFSTDTGPTTVLLTHADHQHDVIESISTLGMGLEVLSGRVGGPATLLPPKQAAAVGI